MTITRSFGRALLGVMLVIGCLAAALAPVLEPGAVAAPRAAITPDAQQHDLVISEFRFQGSGGDLDEFVELFNRSADTLILNGLQLRKSTSGGAKELLYQFPAAPSPDITLESGKHYLVVSPDFDDGVDSDATFDNPGIFSDGGVAITLADGTTILDQAGMGANAYREPETSETMLAPLVTDVDSSYERKANGGASCVDTDDNVADFYLRSQSDPQGSSITAAPCNDPTETPTNTGTATNTGNATPTPTATNSTFHPAVIINEIAYNGTIARSTADWIELFNPGNSPVNLNGWTLEAQDGIPSIHLRGEIAPHGFFLLANGGFTAYATRTPTPGSSPACIVFRVDDDVPIDQYFTGDLESGGEVLYLINRSDAIVDYANRNAGPWPAGSYVNRASMERRGVVPDSDTIWFTYAQANPNQVHDCSGNRVYGSPGSRNWALSVTATPSPLPTRFRTATPTPFGHMVINEFLPRAGSDWNQDGAVDVFDEFIEVKNLGPIAVNLQGWKLDDEPDMGSDPFSLPNKQLQPGERLIFYGLTSGILLEDSGDTVRLINNRNVVIDARGYSAVQAPDQSHCRLPDGYYWRFPCLPTPGLENAQTGQLPVPPPNVAEGPPPCLMADIIPLPFREAECYGFGSDVFNAKYWDDQSGFEEFPVKDALSKGRQIVK